MASTCSRHDGPPVAHGDAVVGHLVLVPAEADAEHEAPAGQVVEGGDGLRGDDRLALGGQGDAGAEADPSVTAAAAASATNGSRVRLYSSGSSASPVGGGVRRLTGMCVCSGR